MGSEKDIVEKMQSELQGLQYGDEAQRDLLCRRAEMVVRRLLGEESVHLKELSKVSFWPSMGPTSDEYKRECWAKGVAKLDNILKVTLEEFELFGESGDS